MASKPPAYQWYVREWLSSPTRRMMPKATRSAYRDLLDYCWDSGKCRLPDDSEHLRILADCTPKEWVSIGPAVRQQFVSIGHGFITNKRLRRVWDERISFNESRKAGAEASVRARENKRTHVQHKSNSASASASTSAKSNTTPLPPAIAGDVQLILWMNETIEVHMGRHRRIPKLEAYQGAMPYVVVEELTRMGYPARIVREQ